MSASAHPARRKRWNEFWLRLHMISKRETISATMVPVTSAFGCDQ